ncbi:MAG TPA: peptide chain release factor 1 [Phycisphaerae bacterium]|jgi:peptide chain release factor 1|nr:peptide chain release factor 1 [Phycisphaerae bacterium]HOB76653.1 peptide chain release factor 1 [Phycisphaerae bacterium]HOJ56671.1 peptide chain release factor 1 [Phycisphaerae bacterium]HOL28456.1 peptide chain release factor 1 [Phycisphaerae bacterium]HPP22951.1 peptide chain release factor 1 [Phycisphaerae bacterium]
MATEVVTDPVIRKLEELRARYEAIGEEMNRPEVAGNPARLMPLTKEHGLLRRMMDPYYEYRKAMATLAESQAILSDPTADPDLKALAEEEIAQARRQAKELMEPIKKALVTGDDAAIDSVILEIRAGTGGDEAALFARDLFGMYQRYADKHGFSVEIMDASPSELGGFKEIILNVRGPGVYQHFGYEGGGHRVQRVPETEAQGRIHTSAATVAVLPEPEEVDVKIDWEKDVIEHVSRAGGPGGQNVNKVSSAIKLEHIPTGITVSMRDEKSQHKNRAKARRVLMSRVYDSIIQAQRSARDANRKTMIGSGDRSQRVRTYNFTQNRCTDHRINLDLYSLDRIMQGDMEELIEALQAYDLEQRLKNL